MRNTTEKIARLAQLADVLNEVTQELVKAGALSIIAGPRGVEVQLGYKNSDPFFLGAARVNRYRGRNSRTDYPQQDEVTIEGVKFIRLVHRNEA